MAGQRDTVAAWVVSAGSPGQGASPITWHCLNARSALGCLPRRILLHASFPTLVGGKQGPKSLMPFACLLPKVHPPHLWQAARGQTAEVEVVPVTAAAHTWCGGSWVLASCANCTSGCSPVHGGTSLVAMAKHWVHRLVCPHVHHWWEAQFCRLCWFILAALSSFRCCLSLALSCFAACASSPACQDGERQSWPDMVRFPAQSTHVSIAL